MSRRLIVPMFVVPLLLGACQTTLEQPHYASGYRTVTDAEGRARLVPEACLAAAVTVDDGAREPMLPPGCANSFNLLQMVERQQDLQRGRASGPAMAAPVGRAAQLYQEGYESAEQRRRWQEQSAQTSTGGGQ